MTILTYVLYGISVPFLLIALFYMVKAKSGEERLLSMAVFGNSFSLTFWVGIVLSILFNVTLLPKILLICAGTASGLFLIILFWCIIYLFNAPKSSRYPN